MTDRTRSDSLLWMARRTRKRTRRGYCLARCRLDFRNRPPERLLGRFILRVLCGLTSSHLGCRLALQCGRLLFSFSRCDWFGVLAGGILGFTLTAEIRANL